MFDRDHFDALRAELQAIGGAKFHKLAFTFAEQLRNYN
jgi:hypothetical protein